MSAVVAIDAFDFVEVGEASLFSVPWSELPRVSRLAMRSLLMVDLISREMDRDGTDCAVFRI